jgi:hypothetical protein
MEKNTLNEIRCVVSYISGKALRLKTIRTVRERIQKEAIGYCSLGLLKSSQTGQQPSSSSGLSN